MKIRITIDGPGSTGVLEKEVELEEKEFLDALAKEWNNENSFHAQPYIQIEVI